MKKILFVPSTKNNQGTGHFLRCIRYSLLCGENNAIYWPENEKDKLDFEFVNNQISRLSVSPELIDNPESGAPWDLIILDHYKTGNALYSRLSKLGPVFTLDEGGAARSRADFLIDSLPLPPGKKSPNLFDLSLLDLPFEKNQAVTKTILVAFGGIGNEKLIKRFLKLINQVEGIDKYHFKIIGNSAKYRDLGSPGNIEFIPYIDDLKSRLKNFSHVVTYFGLTAYEALSSGCRVLLMNPGTYHEKLSRQAGFISMKKDISVLKQFIAEDEWKSPILENEGQNFWTRLKSLELESPICPLCRSQKRKIIERSGEKTYFRCRDCGMEYLYRPLGDPVDYGRDYFFDDYEKQYGKSYLEDFGNIYKSCCDRVDVMNRIVKKQDKSLLDIGCAFGPFLKAAADADWFPSGIDISKEAVAYVKNNFSFPVSLGDFTEIAPDKLPGNGHYDGISLWYVIEHFSNLDKLLSKINKILNPNGVLAFSTPNAAGGSRKFYRKKFFSESPDDHFSLWRPSAVRRWLKRYGFQLKKIRITGHHPERISPLFNHDRWRPLGFFISRLFGWGDTFEIYAVKRRQNK